MDDVHSWFAQPNVGTVETAAAPWWRLVPEGTRIVTIRRPVGEVTDSIARLGLDFDVAGMTATLRRFDGKLDQIERRVPGVLSVHYRDLADEAVCGEIFEHCLPYPRNPQWFALMAPINLQINMVALAHYWRAHEPQLLKVASIARHRSIAAMSRAQTGSLEGMTIQQEPFDDFYRDSQHLFRDHMLVTGQGIEDYTRKNLSLMRILYEKGNLQITTARSNGRVFGYLMVVVAESLDGVEQFEAMQMPFYADPSVPRLGMRLQRASIEALRAKGVDDLYLRVGVRGSGPRLGAMFRRLGAEDAGHLYRLPLKDAA